MTKHKIYLGLGSNLGDRQGNISRAYAEIEKLIGAIVRQSALYESEPWGFESDNSFINSVICCGKIRFIKEFEEMADILRKFGNKYYPSPEEVEEEIRKAGARVMLLELTVDRMTGKLVNES